MFHLHITSLSTTLFALSICVSTRGFEGGWVGVQIVDMQSSVFHENALGQLGATTACGPWMALVAWDCPSVHRGYRHG